MRIVMTSNGARFYSGPEAAKVISDIHKEAALNISVADFREVYPELFQPEETDAEAATRIKKAAEFSRGYDAYQSSRANVYPVGINIPDDLSGEETEETD